MLVLCPTSVMDNWARELATWGTFRVAAYYGSETKRAAVQEAAAAGRLEVVITSYGTLRRCRAALASLPFHIGALRCVLCRACSVYGDV